MSAVPKSPGAIPPESHACTVDTPSTSADGAVAAGGMLSVFPTVDTIELKESWIPNDAASWIS